MARSLRRRGTHGELVAAILESARLHGTRGPDHNGNLTTRCPECLERVGHADDDGKLTLKLQGKTTKGETLTPSNAVWHCYRCDFKGRGDLSSLAEAPDAPAREPVREDAVRLAWAEDMRELAGGARQLDAGDAVAYHVAYLQRRGVLAQARAVGALAVTSGKYAMRIAFPLRPARGVPWWGFTARSILPDPKIRYHTPRGMDRAHSLWGLDVLADAPAGPAWLVEGVFSALPLWPFSLAAQGKEVTDGQIRMLAALGRRVIVCLDGDAWMYARAIAMQLRLHGADAGWCRLPPGKDPGNLSWGVKDYLMPAGQ